MIEVETVLDIAAPPMKVWRTLCDFSSYPRWNPYREIAGVAALGQKVILQIGPDAAKRRSLPAKITEFDPGRTLTFTTGRPIIGLATETFELARSPRGTRLRHAARMKGAGAAIVGRFTFGTGLVKVYQRVDDALADFATDGRQPRRRPET